MVGLVLVNPPKVFQILMVFSSEQLASMVGLMGLNATPFTKELHDSHWQHVNTH